MEQNVVSLPKLLWQVINVQGVLGLVALFIALVIMVIRFLHLMRKDKAGQVTEPEPPSEESLADVIRAHRGRCHMTQEFVAERLGVSRQAVSKWESGQSEPSTANLMTLAELFGVAPEELLRCTTKQH